MGYTPATWIRTYEQLDMRLTMLFDASKNAKCDAMKLAMKFAKVAMQVDAGGRTINDPRPGVYIACSRGIVLASHRWSCRWRRLACIAGADSHAGAAVVAGAADPFVAMTWQEVRSNPATPCDCIRGC